MVQIEGDRWLAKHELAPPLAYKSIIYRMNAPLPHNEAPKEALRRSQLCDPEAEPAFDDLTQLTALICQTPIASISLINPEQQWFNFPVDLNSPIHTGAIALAAQTVDQLGLFMIPDVLNDQAWADQLSIKHETQIRFYAGIPLIGTDHLVMGVLSVMDYIPRELTSAQIEALWSLGSQVIRLLAANQQIAIAKSQQAEFQAILDQTSDLIQIFRWSDQRLLYVNQTWLQTLGYDQAEISQLSWSALLHPDESDRAQTILKNLGQGESIPTTKLSFLTKQGEAISLEGHLFPVWEKSQILAVRGFFRHPIPPESESSPYRQIFENAAEGLFQATLDGRYCIVNPALAHIYGYNSLTEFLAKVETIGQLYVNPTYWSECIAQLATEGEISREAEVYRPNGPTIWVAENIRLRRDAQGYPTAIEGSVQDLTSYKQAEATLQLAKDQLQAVLDAVPGTVSLISSNFRYLGVNRHLAANYQLPPESFVGRKVGFLQPGFGTFMREFFANSTVEASLEIDTEVDGNTRSYLVIAKKWLEDQAAVFVGMDITERKQAQEALLAELAEAAEYVRSLLPPPFSEPVAIESRFIPSQQLGGDCFDYYWLDDENLVIYLLDVSGHGTGPALLSVSVLNLLRSRSLPNTNFNQPSEVLTALNQAFQIDNQRDMYFTIWYGVYNLTQRQLTYASAGHPPAILLSENSESITQARRLRTRGLPIGMFLNADFMTARCTIAKNSSLYLYSDGAYEIHLPDGTIWGLDSFIRLLKDYRHPHGFNLDEILKYLRDLSAKDSFNDDLSLLQINFN